jgi:hypothetical protein
MKRLKKLAGMVGLVAFCAAPALGQQYWSLVTTNVASTGTNYVAANATNTLAILDGTRYSDMGLQLTHSYTTNSGTNSGWWLLDQSVDTNYWWLAATMSTTGNGTNPVTTGTNLVLASVGYVRVRFGHTNAAAAGTNFQIIKVTKPRRLG